MTELNYIHIMGYQTKQSFDENVDNNKPEHIGSMLIDDWLASDTSTSDYAKSETGLDFYHTFLEYDHYDERLKPYL